MIDRVRSFITFIFFAVSLTAFGEKNSSRAMFLEALDTKRCELSLGGRTPTHGSLDHVLKVLDFWDRHGELPVGKHKSADDVSRIARSIADQIWWTTILPAPVWGRIVDTRMHQATADRVMRTLEVEDPRTRFLTEGEKILTELVFEQTLTDSHRRRRMIRRGKKVLLQLNSRGLVEVDQIRAALKTSPVFSIRPSYIQLVEDLREGVIDEVREVDFLDELLPLYRDLATKQLKRVMDAGVSIPDPRSMVDSLAWAANEQVVGLFKKHLESGNFDAIFRTRFAHIVGRAKRGMALYLRDVRYDVHQSSYNVTLGDDGAELIDAIPDRRQERELEIVDVVEEYTLVNSDVLHRLDPDEADALILVEFGEMAKKDAAIFLGISPQLLDQSVRRSQVKAEQILSRLRSGYSDVDQTHPRLSNRYDTVFRVLGDRPYLEGWGILQEKLRRFYQKNGRYPHPEDLRELYSAQTRKKYHVKELLREARMFLAMSADEALVPFRSFLLGRYLLGWEVEELAANQGTSRIETQKRLAEGTARLRKRISELDLRLCLIQPEICDGYLIRLAEETVESLSH